MTLHDHLERLLCVLTLAYVWCILVGLQQEVKLKSDGRRAWSIVTLGLRELVRVLSQPEKKREAQILLLIELFLPPHMGFLETVGY